MSKRQGFTLVELLVAMALTIFIMLILTQAFVLAIDTFVGLKGLGDMQENLRIGANILRSDLTQNHFDGMRRTSDPKFAAPREGCFVINQEGVVASISWPQKPPYAIVLNGVFNNIFPGMNILVPPAVNTALQGPLSVKSVLPNSPPGQTTVTFNNVKPIIAPPPGSTHVLFTMTEGADADYPLASTLSTFCTLHMSCRLKGNQQQSFYTAAVADVAGPLPPPFFKQRTFYNLPAYVSPPSSLDADATLRSPANGPSYRSQWAEIAYFLGNPDPNFGPFHPVGTTEEPLNPTSTNGTPLYGLYRCQCVVVTDNTVVNYVPNPPTNPPTLGYPQSSLLTNFWGLAANPNANNRVSFFTPQDLAAGNRTFSVLSPTTPFATNRLLLTASLVVPNVISFQVQGLDGGFPKDVFYDAQTPSLSLKGVSITIRVWDNKTRQARQLTIMQDL